MLFILPTERGKGLGKTLLQCGIKDYSVNELAHDADGKKYLYDLLAIKKETSSPLE